MDRREEGGKEEMRDDRCEEGVVRQFGISYHEM